MKRKYSIYIDNNWERLNKVYNMLISGDTPIYEPLEGIQSAYNQGITDEFIPPFICNTQSLINDDDGIIFVNFRPDRAVRLAVALSNPLQINHFQTPNKTIFKPKKIIKNILLVTNSYYSHLVKGCVAFEQNELKNIYSEVIYKHGLTQLRIAETEKYPHVTLFFDGGKEKNLPNIKKILIPSPKVDTYDQKPEMSAFQVAAEAKKAILTGNFDTMILNFANPDMVGHTGSLNATIKAIEVVDKCLNIVTETISSVGGTAVIVADHGNAEQMCDEYGNQHTAHTTNLVPIIITDNSLTLRSGALCDVAPTLLQLLKLNKPQEMTGKSLILSKK
ncbi:MAG: 2,3-bisphosphoglycerate-independent phosphoglycerate mutase [Candidatus Phytoplasma australasiaticum]|nr:MAG: 2,3-bisphosphoglycerate-independent phosphoglycerate mutase [Candidatus Phytoplasma australasiaticum]